MRVVGNALTKVDGTLRGALDLRKMLDNAYENARGKLAFGSDKLGALDEIHRGSRDALNQFLVETARNVDVKASLLKQSNLYKASDVLNAKAAKEGSTSLQRFTRQNPRLTKTVKNLAPYAVGGVAAKALIP
jgi:hypothetical protein